jgi:hypothetical protein
MAALKVKHPALVDTINCTLRSNRSGKATDAATHYTQKPAAIEVSLFVTCPDR